MAKFCQLSDTSDHNLADRTTAVEAVDAGDLTTVQFKTEKGQASGYASLDTGGKVPTAQIPTLSYIPTSEKGAASGVASLGSDSKLTTAQMPTQDIPLSFVGKPGSGATMTLFAATRALTIPAALAGAQAVAGTPPGDGSLTLSLKKGATEVGTIAFAQTTGVVTLTAASPIALAAGDVLSLVNAATADSAAADFAITLQATRS